MTYTPSAPIAADFGIRDVLSIDRLVAAVRAAIARDKLRRQYRQMLRCEDHILQDIGVSRDDIRKALRECGGRV